MIDNSAFRSKPAANRSLAPAVPPFGRVPSEVDAALSALGCRAAAGDTQALNALYAAFAPRLEHAIRRAQGAHRRYGGDPAIEPEDIAQQAFVVFAELVRGWDDDRELSRYVLAYFPWRLSDAVRAMSDRRERRSLDALPSALLADGTVEAEAAATLLEVLAGALPAGEARILLLRVRDGCSWNEIARITGTERRTLFRCWKRLLLRLRASLEPPTSPAGGGIAEPDGCPPRSRSRRDVRG